MTKILLSENISPKAIKMLEDRDFEVVIAPSTQEEAMVEAASDVDGIIIRSSELTAPIIEASPNLKIISRHGTGINNIDVETATANNVLVSKVDGANSYSVAEYHITMILALTRRIYKSHTHFLDGTLTSNRDASLVGLANKYDLNGSESRGKLLAILGYGQIGRRLSVLARALNMDVVAYDPYVTEADVPLETDLEALFKKADFFSICLPLTKETKDLIAKEHLEMMKDTAYIINAGRGGVVNEEDLAAALKDGQVAGAALDVFEPEPPRPDNPLLDAPNVILTSHIAGTTFEASEALSIGSAQNIIDFFDGQLPPYTVNREVWGGE